MQVGFRLRLRSEPAPATALLLPSHDTADLLRLCARLGPGLFPTVHLVADGFLLKLSQPLPGPLAGVLRLRALAPDLLLPVDADLTPTLLEDEARALVRRRGLVFLPGGRVLEYAAGEPLPLAGLLGVAHLERRPWRSLPEPPPLADRLVEIVAPAADEPPDALLEAGGEGVGTEEPRPDDASLPAKLAGKAALGVGKGMAWLGSALHLRGLARAGAKLMAGALNWAPRLSESLLGRQEASLRELLREFREGNIERALRRALPLRRDAERGSVPAGGSRLPWHDLRYSLASLLGSGRGRGAIWLSSFDTFGELEKEYRKQAELATRAGDYRRAAFIYGKLLGDYRSAALVLAQGGLHHDAAVLYLKKLGDALAAAREYEAAGLIDRALELYEQQRKHALAGDLLRRLGEEERALAHYLLAASRLVESGQGEYEAGELLRTRAGRPDLALPYYEAGWTRRPQGSFVPCAIRLAQAHADAGAVDRLLVLLGEADGFFASVWREQAAAEFYNEVARLADQPALASVRDDLRDRALLAIAAQLRPRVAGEVRAAALLAAMMGPATVWAPAVVSDARFALTAAAKQRQAPVGLVTTTIVTRVPAVSAVCRAPQTCTIFLGFESGEVVAYQPLRGEVTPLTDERAAILALATDPAGEMLIVLSQAGASQARLAAFSRTAGYRLVSSNVLKTAEGPWLCPLLEKELAGIIGLWTGQQLQFLSTVSLVPVWHQDVPDHGPDPRAGLLLGAPRAKPHRLPALAFGGRELLYYPHFPKRGVLVHKPLGWHPCVPRGSTLKAPLLAWLQTGADELELAGLGPEGELYRSSLRFEGDEIAEVTTDCARGRQGYVAATLVRSHLVAAVTRTALHWLRRGARGLQPVCELDIALPPAVACFASYPTNELVVVCDNGTVARVPQIRY